MDKKPKILLVDDEPDILSMTKMRLASAGYEVITAEEGVMAYNMAKSETPDLIIFRCDASGDGRIPYLPAFEI